MHASYSNNFNFPSIRINCSAGEFMKVLKDITDKYDDGQGRSYDILDSECHDCHLMYGEDSCDCQKLYE